MREDVVVIYTDGACSRNPGPGGWGALLLYKGTARFLSGFVELATNNQMELSAAIMALKVLKRKSAVELNTDSLYLKDGIQKWLSSWQRNNWRTSGNRPVKNQELWVELSEEAQRHVVRWKWVRGHSEDKYNNFVDWLARDAILRRHGRDAKMMDSELTRIVAQPERNR